MQRLLAILAADVAGYSRLMATDASATVAALDAARDVFKAMVEANHGRIIDMAGDSVLAVFETAAGAARSGIGIQRALAEASEAVSEDRRMRFRIGVHLGDVIQKPDGTVYGSGVNIAARLEGLTPPGGITVSESIRSALLGQVDAVFEDLGEQWVKNIPQPVRAHRLVLSGGPRAPEIAPPSVPERASIAVLPFDNMSGDAEQEFFADGITEDIITELARISGLLVIARNSTFALKKQALDIKEVGRRFGVRHVLEGSVRKSGTRVRITAQLIDAVTGGHVWAERYDRNLEDIFAVQDEVSASIVEQLHVRLTASEQKSLGHRRNKIDPEVYDLYMRGRAQHARFSAEGCVQARELFGRAIAIDPLFAPPYGGLALMYPTETINNWVESSEHLDIGMEYARRAVQLDPEEAHAHQAMTLIALLKKDFDAAERAAVRTIEVSPGAVHSLVVRGQVCDFTGRHTEAIAWYEKALRIDPADDLILGGLGRAQFGAGRLDEAISTFTLRLSRVPYSDMSRVYLASIHGAAGRAEEARRLWGEILEINPTFSIERLKRTLPFKDASWFERLESGLRSAGVVDGARPA
jgi:adenylate cyclase